MHTHTHTQLLFLSVACGSMAMFFKEHGITAFGVCLVYDVLIVSRPAVKKYVRLDYRQVLSLDSPVQGV